MSQKFINELKWAFETMYREATKPLKLNIQFFGDVPTPSFGLADVKLENLETNEVVLFDGSDLLHADGGELSLTPSFKEINFKDTGDTVDERRAGGWTGSFTMVVGQDDLRLLKMALGPVTAIMSDGAQPEVVGYTDAKIGTKLSGYRVTIHPRVLPANDKRFDITIYNMASTGGISKPYNDEHTRTTITLEMMPRPGLNASQGSNFFYTGPLDPNATTP